VLSQSLAATNPDLDDSALWRILASHIGGVGVICCPCALQLRSRYHAAPPPPVESNITGQCGLSRRVNLKRRGESITAPTKKIVTPATMSRMLNGSSIRLASRGKRDSGM